MNPIPDLAGRLDAGINALDPFNPNATGDDAGHGTSVAAIIAATANNGSGIAGVAPGVHIVPVKACEPYINYGIVFCYDPMLYSALYWLTIEALDGRIDVVNMSLGGPNWDSQIEYYLQFLKDQGVIVAAAAGNTGTAPLEYPGRSPNVVGVGGSHWDGLTVTRDPGSSYGADLDVVAPFETYAPDQDGQIVDTVGTSFSTPVISGLAALFKSTQPSGRNDAYHLLNGTDYFLHEMQRTGTGFTYREWNQETGYGIPNAFTTIWATACLRYDTNHDNMIDVVDVQRMALRYGTYFGDLFYDPWYDVDPPLARDGDIDIWEFYRTLNKDGMTCPTP